MAIDWYDLGRKAAENKNVQPNTAFAIDFAQRWTPGLDMETVRADWQRGYDSVGLVIAVSACPRCALPHEHLLFKETSIGALGNHYVASCPIKGLPILMEELP